MTAQPRAGAGAWYALVVLVLATVFSAVDKILFTLLAEPIRLSLHVTDTQLGMVQGVGLLLFTGLATFPLGWLGDRFDRRWVLGGCIVFWSAMTALRGTAPDYTMLLVASIGLGIGEAGLAPITQSLLPDLFPRRQRVVANAVYILASVFGAALGALLGGGAVSAAGSLRPLLPAAMQSYESWRLAFFLVAASGIPMALLVFAMRPVLRGRYDGQSAPAASPAVNSPQAANEFRDYLRANWRTIAGLVVGTGLGGIGLNGIASWLPVHAARAFDLDPAKLGQYLGASYLGGTLLGAIVGVAAMRSASRKLGPRAPLRILCLGYLCAGLMSLALLAASSAAALFVAMALIFMPLLAAAVVLPNALQDMAPAPLRARAIAMIMLCQLPFTALGPVGVGMLSDVVRKVAPEGLLFALVGVTLVTGCAGALALRLAEASFTRLALANRAAAGD
jgi:predicted MFS family arabinose efflux permease